MKDQNKKNIDSLGLFSLKIKESINKLQTRALTYRSLLKPQLIDRLSDALMNNDENKNYNNEVDTGEIPDPFFPGLDLTPKDMYTHPLRYQPITTAMTR